MVAKFSIYIGIWQSHPLGCPQHFPGLKCILSSGSVLPGELRGFPPQGFPTVGKSIRRRFSSPHEWGTQGSSVSNFKKC